MPGFVIDPPQGPRGSPAERTERPRLPLLQQPRRLDGPISEEDVRARPAQAEQALDQAAIEVEPAVLRGGLEGSAKSNLL